MAHKLLKLGTVLQELHNYSWNKDSVFLQDEYPWNPSSVCAVLQPQDKDYEPNEIDLDYAKRNDLKETLSVRTAQQIVENARQQKKGISESELVDAFNYYFGNDAFILF